MKKEILRLEQVFAPPYLFGFNMDIYSGELDALIGFDYIGMDYLLDIIQYNRTIHYGRVFYNGVRVNDQAGAWCKQNKVIILNKNSTLTESLSVAENIFVIRSGFKRMIINRKMIQEQTLKILTDLGIAIDPCSLVSSLSPYEKIILEIVKSWISGVSLVILGNISTFLTPEEVERTIVILHTIATHGMAFLYICNHHQEAFKYCDRCFFMKKGKMVKCLEKGMMKDDIVKKYSYVFTSWLRNKQHQQLFEQKPLCVQEGFYCQLYDMSFSMRKGETIVVLDSDSRLINSLFELMNNGREEIDKKLRVDRKKWRIGNRRTVLIPPHPVDVLLFPQMPVLDNICFTLDDKVKHFWFTNKKKMAVAQDLYPVFGDTLYANSLNGLSDKTLYDIIYQRILLQRPSFLCVMQPLASADMMMRLRLLEYFDAFKEKGITVCILAYALSDSLEVADRLLVIKDGKIEKEYQRSEFSLYPGISGSRPG